MQKCRFLCNIYKIATALEIIAGKWGNGEERRKKLTAAGYNYSAVQNRVNELMR